MRKRFMLLALFLFIIPLLLLACSPKKSPKKPQQITTPLDYGKPVVQVLHSFQVARTDTDGEIKIENKVGVGTGFVVNVSGLVLTNYHIAVNTDSENNTVHVHGSDKLEVCLVKNGTQTCNEARAVDTDVGNDMALLFVTQAFEEAVIFADDRSLKPLDIVYLWGNIHDWVPPSPILGNFINRIEPPYTTQEEFKPITLPLLLLDIAFIQGSSGGPTFDQRGRCVGQNKFFTNSDGGRPIGIATPSSTIMKFLDKNKVKYKKQ